MNRPGQSITITGEAVRKALAEKRSLRDLAYDDTRLALLSDFLANPNAEHPTIKPELIPDDYVFKALIVDELPDIGTASRSALYLVPQDKPDEDNRYWEYIKTEPTAGRYAWERIGSSEVDLSQYAKKEDVELTPREMVWECEPRYMHSSTLRVVFQETEHANRYNLLAGDTIVAESYVGDRQDDLMFIDFRAVGVTATRRPAYVLGSQDDKPLVPANALSGISNPKLGEVASVLGWNAKTTKEGE